MKIFFLLSILALLASPASCRTEVPVVNRLPTDGRPDFYVFNRAPLAANGLVIVI